MRFKLLVFDWDGTIADSVTRIVDSALDAIADLGLPAVPGESIRQTIGLGFADSLEQLFPGQGEALVPVFTNYYRQHFLRYSHQPIPLFPGAVDTLSETQRNGYFLAVATGKSRRGLDRELAEHDLSHLFEVSRCADEAPSKPNPQMLLEIMQELHVGADEVLMIGDTDYDLEMARSVGVASLGVLSGAHEQTRLLRCEPLDIIESVASLPDWLANRGISK